MPHESESLGSIQFAIHPSCNLHRKHDYVTKPKTPSIFPRLCLISDERYRFGIYSVRACRKDSLHASTEANACKPDSSVHKQRAAACFLRACACLMELEKGGEGFLCQDCILRRKSQISLPSSIHIHCFNSWRQQRTLIKKKLVFLGKKISLLPVEHS